jgi:hypothetical protein
LFNEANSAVNSRAWSGLGSVGLLNICTDTVRIDYQDELILIPAPGAALVFAVLLTPRTPESGRDWFLYTSRKPLFYSKL